MPAEIFGERYKFLPRAELLTYEEIDRLSRIFVNLGVRKLRLTGGEPLLRKDVHDLVSMLAANDRIEDLTLTTNGYLLKDQAGRLREAGLNRITVSLDSLDPQVFGRMNGVGYGPQHVLEGIAAATEVGLNPIKINAVIEKDVNDHTVLDLVRYFKGSGHIVRFIEFMDVGTLNAWDRSKVIPSRDLVKRISTEFPIEPLDPNYPGEVADRWRFVDGDGEIGFISSVTQPFCTGCTRARISPEGEFYTCLFAAKGYDLKQMIRAGSSDTEISAQVTKIWSGRTDRYSELRSAMNIGRPNKVEMYHIGG